MVARPGTMARGLALLALAAGALCANAFLLRPVAPSTGPVQTGAGAPLVAPLQMAKHPEFKIIKKKMHKRPKKTRPSERNRRPHEHAVDKRDMSGTGLLLPEEEGWMPYDEAVHGALDQEILARTQGLETIWVRKVDDNGMPVLQDA